MSNVNVRNAVIKNWDKLDYYEKRAVCLWYNREIKQMPFGAFILAHLQAMFTFAEKTVKKMNCIYKALQLRDSIVKDLPSKSSGGYDAAMGALEPAKTDNNKNQNVAQDSYKNQCILPQIKEFLALPADNGDIKMNLIKNLKNEIQSNILEGKVGNLCYALTKVEKSITSESKSEDVKKQLEEATTKLDTDVNTLLNKAVESGAITQETKENLIVHVTKIKAQNKSAINEKLEILEKMKPQAERKAANAEKTETQLLDGLAGEVSKLPEQKQQFNINSFTDAGKALLLNEVKAGRKLEFYHNYLSSEEDKQAMTKEVFEGIGTAGYVQILKDLHRGFGGKNYMFSYGAGVDDAIKQQCDLLNNYDEMLKLQKDDRGNTDYVYLAEILGKIVNEMGDEFKGFSHAGQKDKTKIFTDVLSFMPSQGEQSMPLEELKNKLKFEQNELGQCNYIDKEGCNTGLIYYNQQRHSYGPPNKYSVHFEKNQSGQMSVLFGYSGSYTSLVTDKDPDCNSAFKIQKNAVVDYDIKYRLVMGEDGKTVTGITLDASSKYSIAVFENGTQQVQVFEGGKKSELHEGGKKSELQDIIPSSSNEPKRFTA